MKTDPDQNVSGSCSAPEPDMDPDKHVKHYWVPNLCKVSSKPQHWHKRYRLARIDRSMSHTMPLVCASIATHFFILHPIHAETLIVIPISIERLVYTANAA